MIAVIGFAFGVVGVTSAVWFYYHLWKWAREMQHVRLAVQYKNKVKFDNTLTELLLMARLIDKKEANGQVFYTANNTRIALLKQKHQIFGPRQFIREVRGWLLAPLRKLPKPSNPRIGSYKTRDDTPPENRAPVQSITPSEALQVSSRRNTSGQHTSGVSEDSALTDRQ